MTNTWLEEGKDWEYGAPALPVTDPEVHSLPKPMEIKRVLARFRSQWDLHVWSASRLEGNPYTLPQVRTLLENVTTGGHKVSDTLQVQAIIDGNRMVYDLVASGKFAVTKEVLCKLHAQVARYEALDAGHFRGQGEVDAIGGTVRRADGGTYTAPPPPQLDEAWNSAKTRLEAAPSVRAAELFYCDLVLAQLFYDGNKRTARLMANGVRLANGYDAIAVPAQDQLRFNQLLNDLFTTLQPTALVNYLANIALEPISQTDQQALTKSADQQQGLPIDTLRQIPRASYPDRTNPTAGQEVIGTTSPAETPAEKHTERE